MGTKREVITPKTCLSCGACCIAPQRQKVFCNVSEEDAKRLGKKFVRLNVIQPNAFDRLYDEVKGFSTDFGVIRTEWTEQKHGPLKGFELNTCAALRGSVMSNVRCSVYKERPSVCHTAVVPGDRRCRDIRAAFRQVVGA